MSKSEPLRVHLVHQSFGDYVGALVDGFVAPDRVLPGVEVADGERGNGVDLSVTTVLTGSPSRSALRPIEAPHRTLAIPRFRHPRSLPAAIRVVKEVVAQPCDVLHWQAAGNPWVDAAFSQFMARRPTVVTVHDMQPHPGDRTVLPGAFVAIRRLVRRADRVIVHAPHVGDQVVAAGVDRNRVVVLEHGELGSRYLEPDQLPLARSAEPVVLFFGRAQGYKGLDVLADAMAKVVEDLPSARLLVAGSGPSLEEVFPEGQATPPWADIRRGSVPDDQVIELFGRAAVVALPYREASQSGVAALAAGFGRPVVASAVPGLADIVEDGVSGRLVVPDSADALAAGLLELLSKPDLASDLCQGAHQAATTRLSWPSVAARTTDVYTEALRNHER